MRGHLSRDIVTVVAVVAVGLIGVYFITAIRAASLYVNLESEDGTVSGPASIKTDTLASGGRYVQFGSSSASNFSISGTSIIDPSGHAFVPVGTNLLGPNSFWPANTTGLSSVAKNDWKFNTIRLNTCMPGGCNGSVGVFTNNNDISSIVSEYTGAGLVVNIDSHQVQSGVYPGDTNGTTTETSLSDLTTWWVGIANEFKNNPYVWFDLLNEPGHGTSVSSKYLDDYTTLIKAIRGTGAQNMIVVEATNWGQDSNINSTPTVNTSDSGILTYGKQLSALSSNILFSVHIYNGWSLNSDITTSAEQSLREARLTDYFNRVHALGLPIFIGEIGGHDNDGPPDYGITAGTAPTGSEITNSENSLASVAGYEVAAKMGIGILAWHGTPSDGFDLVSGTTGTPAAYISAINSPTDPTNLTWSGQLLWNRSHSPQ